MSWVLPISVVIGLLAGLMCGKILKPAFWPACSIVVGLVVMNIGAMADPLRRGRGRSKLDEKVARLRVRSFGVMVALGVLLLTLLWQIASLNPELFGGHEAASRGEAIVAETKQLIEIISGLRDSLTGVIVALAVLTLLLFWVTDTLSQLAAAREAQQVSDTTSA